MRRTIFGIAVLLLLAVPVQAQRVITFEALTVDNTAAGVAIATATLSGQRACQGRLEAGEIRMRADGTAPTATVGTLVYIGDTIEFANVIDAAAHRFIRTGAVSGVLSVSCWQ